MTKSDYLKRIVITNGFPSGPISSKKPLELNSSKFGDTSGLEKEIVKKFLEQTESEYFTVKYKYQLSKRRLRLFIQTYLDMLIRREFGEITFVDFLVLEDLYNRLKDEISEEPMETERFRKIDRELLLILEIYLESAPAVSHLFIREGVQGFKEKIVHLSENFFQTFNFSTDREYNSRLQTYAPENWVVITVEVPFPLSRESQTKPYSSYTKGHPSPGRKGQAPLPLWLQPERETGFLSPDLSQVQRLQWELIKQT